MSDASIVTEVIDAGGSLVDTASDAYNRVTTDIGTAYGTVATEVNTQTSKIQQTALAGAGLGTLVFVVGILGVAYVASSPEAGKTVRQLFSFKWG